VTDLLLDVDRVLEEVANEAGLDDYGDPSFREGLDILVESCSREAQLNDIGRATLDGQVRGSLRNRLRVIDWHNQYAELAFERIVEPVFVVGASRTGTTALSGLLAADPANRSLLGFEVQDSVPPPQADGYWDDPRFVAARQAPDMLAMLNPGFRAIHYDPPDGPMECVTVLAQHFLSAQLVTVFNIPMYHRWMLDADEVAAYQYHQLVLQLLQSGKPGRWHLKSPHHAVAMDALTTVYPDAKLVVTHRDPVKTLASTCSLVVSLTGTFTDADFRTYIAEIWTDTVDAMVNRTLDFRDAHPEVQYVDVLYDDFIADPVAAVARLYDELDRELTPEAEKAMREIAAREPQHKFGRHTYSLADIGLRREDVEDRFARYFERFPMVRKEVA
jgi:hypothetical protein